MEKLLEITVGQALREQAKKNSGKEFLVFPKRNIRYTFGDVDKYADVIAKGLLSEGFRKGDHIGIWAHNIPEWAVLFYAIVRAGFVVVPINVNCKCQELSYILANADIKCLFLVEKYRDNDLREILCQAIPQLEEASAGNLRSALFPQLKTVVTIGNTVYPGMYSLENILEIGRTIDNFVLEAAEAAVTDTDIAAIMYTSGTTGFPKGAMLTHRSMLNSIYYAFLRGVVIPGEIETIFNPLPCFYITALSGCLLGGILFGHKIVQIEIFDPGLSLEIIQNEQCSRIFGVPAIFLALMGHPKYKDTNLQSVKDASIGGANCSVEMLREIFTRMRLRSIFHLYGLTESSPFITDVLIKSPDDSNLFTVGTPLPGMEVSVRDRSNKECPLNTVGEICTRGYGVMRGYYKMEDATHEAIDADGWLHTGDLGYLTDGNYLVLKGRLKELIISRGENIYPKELENLLISMPGVHDVQAVGIQSEKYGEVVGAFIILKPDYVISEQDVMDYCRARISFQKVPRYVFFVTAFPLSGNGKVQKFKLSQMGAQMLAERGITP